MEADISSQAVGLASSADFSLVNLFIRADIIVKSVIIILIALSISKLSSTCFGTLSFKSGFRAPLSFILASF